MMSDNLVSSSMSPHSCTRDSTRNPAPTAASTHRLTGSWHGVCLPVSPGSVSASSLVRTEVNELICGPLCVSIPWQRHVPWMDTLGLQVALYAVVLRLPHAQRRSSTIV